MGRKSKNYIENYTENYTELDGINNLVPKQQTIKLTEEEWSELNNGSKGSDDHISDISKMVEVPQQEISDEEIEKAKENAWSDYEYQEGNLYSTTFSDGWEMAIKWYREQLISQAHTNITRIKGKEYAPTSNEIQSEIEKSSGSYADLEKLRRGRSKH